jgi:hypothetical protein
VDPPYTGILSNTVAGPSCRSCIADVLEAKGLTPRLEGILETQHALHQPEPANCDHDVAFAASDHPPESLDLLRAELSAHQSGTGCASKESNRFSSLRNPGASTSFRMSRSRCLVSRDEWWVGAMRISALSS